MNWQTNDNTDRTYVFNYDNLSRLTSATYSQAGNPLANYSESSSYDTHGNVTGIQRFGRTGTGTFGLIDNLTMNYNGNQLVKAEDAISTSNFSHQGDFRNGVIKTVEYEYDKNGNMTKNFNKVISSISYNSLNLPVSLSIANDLGSATNNYTYSADGKKLKVEMKFGNQTMTTDYVDNIIYENGGLKRILVDGGYVENGQYHFYIQDHLGNNRVVAKTDGTVIQTNHYYPYGMTFTEDNTGDPKAQPYKYGGKEFDGERGLNLYDFLARSVDATTGRFTSIDPLADKFYSVSPYVYCNNNPVNLIDPDGKNPIIAYAFAKGALCGLFDLGTQVGISMIGGKSVGEAFSDVDITSVTASTISGAASVPGMGMVMKGLAGFMEAVDAAVDVKKSGVAYVGGSGTHKKTVSSAVIDKVPSAIVGKGVNKISKNFVKAINEDLSSKAAATLTKQTKTAMRTAESVLKSQKFNLVSDLGTIFVGGLTSKAIDESTKNIKIPYRF